MSSQLTFIFPAELVHKQLATAKVHQLHLKGVWIDQNILRLDEECVVKNSTITAVTSSSNHLLHELLGKYFRKAMTVTEFLEARAAGGAFQHQDDIGGRLEPFQHLHYILTARRSGHHLHRCHHQRQPTHVFLLKLHTDDEHELAWVSTCLCGLA